jgi:hypothetical protein
MRCKLLTKEANNLRIIVNGFYDEEKEHVKRGLQQAIDQISAGLDLSTLESIFVTEDFGKEVIAFQEQHNLTERGYTDHEYGTAVAKVMEYWDGDQFKQAVFLSQGIVYALFTENVQKAAHMIHHELCHVHDNYHKSKFYTNEGRAGIGIDPLTHLLYIHADGIWSEYIANRLSYPTLGNMEDDYLIPYMMDLMTKVKEDVNKEIEEYRVHGDIDHLFGEVQVRSFLFLKIASSVIGYIQAAGLRRDQVEEIFNPLDIHETLVALFVALDNLYNLNEKVL